MARPRIFVSSTYYDLRHIRSNMEGFIEGMGYDAVLFENGDIPFHNDISLAEACYAEVQTCHMLVLIVGGRYGSADEERRAQGNQGEIERMYEAYNSVTRKEYETAREKHIPIFIFVDRNVRAEYETFKSNRENASIRYAHVDSVNIFKLLDDILQQKHGNFIKDFEKFGDISSWLKEQWAGIFADLMMSRKEQVVIKTMTDRIAELTELTASMKSFTETLMKNLLPNGSADVLINEEAKRDRSRKISRFRKEPFISFIRTQSRILDGDAPPSTVQLFNALERSTDFSNFLDLARVGDQAKAILKKHGNDANYAYAELAKNYFDRGDDVDDLSDLI